MKRQITRIVPIGLLATALILPIAFNPVPVFADSKPITGDFTGKTMCQNGLKKAGFKDPHTKNITYYTLNEISRQAQALSWPEPDNPMNFDEREKLKVPLQHVITLLRELSCDTQDNPAQSNGLNPGTQNATQPGARANGYVQSPLPNQ